MPSTESATGHWSNDQMGTEWADGTGGESGKNARSWGLAVYSFVPQNMGWRVMFLVGLLPPFLIIWGRRNV